MRESRATVVDVRAATKVYASGTRALAPVTFAVQHGDFVTLLGPSGCGKTTLLQLLAGLDDPTDGTLRWWGADTPYDADANTSRPDNAPDKPHAAASIGYVFQTPTLMPWARVDANVRLPLDLAHVSRDRAEPVVQDALARVGLGEFAHAFPRELSGGMRMRVSIARALVMRPRLLLLDEPFGALDEWGRLRMDDDLIAEWQRASLTVVFVTHSIAEAVYLSTRVIVMAARPGRIIADVAIDAPYPRSNVWRGSPAFAARCVELSERVAAASGRSDG